jgi:formiminotetrahydrofolate cyclodeaminase
MFKKVFAFTVLLTFGAVSYAAAACTPEEATAKAQAFQQAIMQAAQKDPQKYQAAMAAMQNDLPKLQQANNLDAMCKFYDDWTAKMK